MKSLKSKLYLLLAVLILILSMLASCGVGQQPPEGGDDGEGDGGKDETPTNTADAPLDLESVDPVIIGANDTFIGD